MLVRQTASAAVPGGLNGAHIINIYYCHVDYESISVRLPLLSAREAAETCWKINAV